MNIFLCIQAVFWTSVGFIGYAYVGYPLLLMLLGVVRNRPIDEANLNGCNDQYVLLALRAR
jgi:hypothetical protein